MNYVPFSQIGNLIADHWGIKEPQELDKKIASMDMSQKTVCLLAAAVLHLKVVHKAIFALQLSHVSLAEKLEAKSEAELEAAGDPIADAMLLWSKPRHGNACGLRYCDLNKEDLSELSYRARRALRRLGGRYGFLVLSRITPELIKQVKGCGDATVCEVMAWRDRQWQKEKR